MNHKNVKNVVIPFLTFMAIMILSNAPMTHAQINIATWTTSTTRQEPLTGSENHLIFAERTSITNSVSFKYVVSNIDTGPGNEDVLTGTFDATFAPGQYLMSFPVVIYADDEHEEDEKFKVELCCIVGGLETFGSTIEIEITILANGYPYGLVFFEKATQVVEAASESPVTYSIGLIRSGGTIGSVSAYIDGEVEENAGPQFDFDTHLSFSDGSNAVTWAAGESGLKFLSLTLVAEPGNGPRPSQNVILEIDHTVNGLIIDQTGNSNTEVVVKAKGYPYGSLAFQSTEYSIDESLDSSVTLDISRTCDNCGPLRVRVTARSGTAVEGSDFQAFSNFYSFDSGQLSTTFTMPICQNLFPEYDQYFFIDLESYGDDALVSTDIGPDLNSCDTSLGGCAQITLVKHHLATCPAVGVWSSALQGEFVETECTPPSIGYMSRQCNPAIPDEPLNTGLCPSYSPSAYIPTFSPPITTSCVLLSQLDFDLREYLNNPIVNKPELVTYLLEVSDTTVMTSNEFTTFSLVLVKIIDEGSLTAFAPSLTSIVGNLLDDGYRAVLFSNTSLAFKLENAIVDLATGLSEDSACSDSSQFSSDLFFALASKIDFQNQGAQFSNAANTYKFTYPSTLAAYLAEREILTCETVYFVVTENANFYPGNTQRKIENGENPSAGFLPVSGVATTGISNVEDVSLPEGEENEFVFVIPHNRQLTPSEQYRVVCGWWIADGTRWSTEGCRVIETNETETTCGCTHLTSFAILFDLSRNLKQSSALKVVSYVGCAVSLAGALFTFLTFAILAKLRTFPMKLVMVLCFSIILTQVLFILAAELPSMITASSCAVLGALLHYALLVQFCICFIQALNLYLVVDKNKLTSRWFWRYMLFTWVFPAVIIAIYLVIFAARNQSIDGAYGDMNDNEQICFIANTDGQIYAFVVPALTILGLNLVLFGFITGAIHKTTHNKFLNNERPKAEVAAAQARELKLYASIALVIGLTWVFAALIIINGSEFSQYLFIVANALQGIGIFVLYCLTPAILGNYRAMFCCQSSSAYQSTSSGANPTAYTAANNTGKDSSATSSNGGPSESIEMSTIASETENSTYEN